MTAAAGPEDRAGSGLPEDGRVAVRIDGREVRVDPGTLVLDAATQAGVHVPIYCAHPKMDPVAVCRMCLVRIGGAAKLQPACATTVADGMEVTTSSEEVARFREGLLEFLLLNHPLDCPVCDRGGECDLQDFAHRYGPGTSRFPITDKVHFDKAVRLSDRIELDQERCILCWRCTRFYEEITGEKELVLQQRGVHTLIAPFDGRPLRSEFQGNLPEVCPVGALTHVQFRFAARPWDLQRTRGVCPECAYGCNINVDTRDFEVKRFASRDNPLVDDMWLCDRGRYSATAWNDPPRIRRCRVRGPGGDRETEVSEAVAAAGRELRATIGSHGPEAVGVLGSPQATNEELWLLQRLAREVIGTPHIDHRLEPLPQLGPVEHALGIAEIEECEAVIVLGEEPERACPVLTLRLFKAGTKRGRAVHRVPPEVDGGELASRVGGAATVGVIADESHRAQAARAVAALAGPGRRVRRLTTTRGVNGRGAKDLGVSPALLPGYRPAAQPGRCGREILTAAAAGEIRTLVVLGSSAALAGPALDAALRARPAVVTIATRPEPVVEAATVLIPGHAFFEKAGSVTNVEGRVQRIRSALPPASSTPPETRVLSLLAIELGATGWGSGDPLLVHRELCAALPAYAAAGPGGRARFAEGDG